MVLTGASRLARRVVGFQLNLRGFYYASMKKGGGGGVFYLEHVTRKYAFRHQRERVCLAANSESLKKKWLLENASTSPKESVNIGPNYTAVPLNHQV